MSTRRETLKEVSLVAEGSPNAGLWLDKFITNQSRENKEARRTLVNEGAGIPEPGDYGRFFTTWEKNLERLGARCIRARASGRVIVGLGGEGVIETSITLHKTYGMPYIPGSALKGMAGAFARHHCGEGWQKGSPYYKAVFGETDDAGYVTFFDALYVPGSGRADGEGKAHALWTDVMTVHHQNYYQGKKDARGDTLAPADWDDPNPVPFLSATGDYLVALSAPPGCESWRERAFEILGHALYHAGVGAKTASGYGRLMLDGYNSDGDIAGGATHTISPENDERRKVEEIISHVRELKDNEVAGRIGRYVEAWRGIAADSEHKRRVAAEIVARIKRAGREKASRDKDWYKELLAYT